MIEDHNLIDEINTLPPDEQAEVVDFIKRLKAKKRTQAELSDPNNLDPILGLGSQPVPDNVADATFKRKFGSMKGIVKYMAEDFNQPLQLVPDVPEPASKHSLCELRGLGKELWQTIQVDTFLEEERNAWG